MTLEIWRNQKDVKGLLGGHKGVSFSIVARVQISEEEKALIAKYRLEGEILLTFKYADRDEAAEFITTQDLLQGKTFETRDLSELLRVEREVKSSCATLKTYLEVAGTFGGYEAMEV